MKIFLTGGTGFIGSHFINVAMEKGYDVVALRRKGSVQNVPLVEEPLWVEGDLNSGFEKEFASCSVLVHLAAHSPNPPYDSLEQCLYWNLTASLNFCIKAAEAGISQFVVAGSSFEYGRAGERYKYIPADAPLEPVDSYPTSKAAASIAFYGWAVERALSMQILRIFQVYGEGEPEGRLWPSLRGAAEAGEDFPMTEGQQVRDFVHVHDVATAIVDALEFDNVSPGQPILRNIGSGREQTVREFSEYWWNFWNAKGKLEIGKLEYRANNLLRIVPEIDEPRKPHARIL